MVCLLKYVKICSTLNCICISSLGYENEMEERLYLRLIKLENMMKRESESIREELKREMEEKISKLEANPERC